MNTTIADGGSATGIDQPEARELRRSSDDKMLAGVAGGIARYLSADVTLVRVIIAALELFTGAGVALRVRCAGTGRRPGRQGAPEQVDLARLRASVGGPVHR
jgi:phage shock protein PspC (stress-responsive transcriptional regulator)